MDLMKIDGVITMDSREIAELTMKDHSHICRDIRVMLEGLGVGESKYGSSYLSEQNKPISCYLLPYRETMILVSGYSVPLRAKVIDRWIDLEKSQVLPNFSDPVKAARAWADAMEQKQIAETRVNRLIHDNKTFTTSEIAKEIGMKSAQELNQALLAKGISYKDARGVWLLHSQYSGKEFQRIKESEKNGKVIYYAEWTGIGRDWLLGIFSAE
jgi:phage regulator Rha-like protein